MSEKVKIQVTPNGPLVVNGTVEITLPSGETKTEEQMVVLCRCGASKMKPNCDGSHAAIKFEG